jgi:hypothetical protein
MSTFPLGNNVAVCESLAAVILPVAVKVPVAGLYSSALARSKPPAMSTFPLDNRVAVCSDLATVMLPVATKTPCNTVVPVVPAELVAPPAVPVVPEAALVSVPLVASIVAPVLPASTAVELRSPWASHEPATRRPKSTFRNLATMRTMVSQF